MENSVPNSLEALLSRQSMDSPQAPAPQGEILDAILKSGLCAPDHGRVRPWRWVTVSGAENCASLGKKVAEALKRQAPETDDKKLFRLERRFASAPMAIVIGGEFIPECPISRSEQEYSVAAGAMNILNALSFSGFGGIWLSGAYGEDAQLRKELGLEEDSERGGILGIILAGSIPEKVAALGKKRRPVLADHVLSWPKC